VSRAAGRPERVATPQTSREPGPPESLEELHEFLRAAVQLELSVIPPYLCGLYSMAPGGDNLESALILRSIVTEEMLHLTLAANVLMAVGGGPPTLASAETVSPYPIVLAMERDLPPEQQFLVHLLPFSPTALDMYLKIENPAHEHDHSLQAAIDAPAPTMLLSAEFGFGTVGAFYEAIEQGLTNLTGELGEDAVFSGDRRLQIEPQYYYAGGGVVRQVHGLDDALAALGEIVDQGEGDTGSLYDEDGDLAHYFRFMEVKLGRRYQPGDKPDSPSGEPFTVDFGAVYPMKPDPRSSDYGSEELRAASDACNRTWSELLRLLDRAFAGTDPAAKGEDLIAAVAQMLDLRDQASMLLRIPLPDGKHAGPTFEYVEE
jgi:hypothetical protein